MVLSVLCSKVMEVESAHNLQQLDICIVVSIFEYYKGYVCLFYLADFQNVYYRSWNKGFVLRALIKGNIDWLKRVLTAPCERLCN